MSPVSGIGGLNEVKAMLGTGSVDSRSIHFGANESKEDRMRRIEEITKGNPNVKLSPEAFQKLMQGGDVDVTLNLDAPDRRNLFIGAFATLAQIGGSAGGAAYNKDLGEAVAGRVSGDAQYIAKHGNNYKMNLFGGASAQTGRIEVGDPVFNPTLSNDNVFVDAIKKNLAVQATGGIRSVNKPQEENTTMSIADHQDIATTYNRPEQTDSTGKDKKNNQTPGVAGQAVFNTVLEAGGVNQNSINRGTEGRQTVDSLIAYSRVKDKNGKENIVNNLNGQDLLGNGKTTEQNIQTVRDRISYSADFIQAAINRGAKDDKGRPITQGELDAALRAASSVTMGTDGRIQNNSDKLLKLFIRAEEGTLKDLKLPNGSPFTLRDGKFGDHHLWAMQKLANDSLERNQGAAFAINEAFNGRGNNLSTEQKKAAVEFLQKANPDFFKGVTGDKFEFFASKLKSGDETALKTAQGALAEITIAQKTLLFGKGGSSEDIRKDGFLGMKNGAYALGNTTLAQNMLSTGLLGDLSKLGVSEKVKATLGNAKLVDSLISDPNKGTSFNDQINKLNEAIDRRLKPTPTQATSETSDKVTLTIGGKSATLPELVAAINGDENGKKSITSMSQTDRDSLISVLKNAQKASESTPKSETEAKTEGKPDFEAAIKAVEGLAIASPDTIQKQNQDTITKNIGNVNTFLNGNGNQTESQLQKAKEAIKKIKEDIGSATPENQELFKKLETRLGAIVAQTNAGAIGAAKTTQDPSSDPLLAQFSNIGKSLPPAEKPKDDSSLKKVLEELAKAGNEIASILFGVADQILDRLNKEAAGSFDYGFGHQNGGRITKKIGGAEDQDKDSNGNSNVSSQAFQDGFKTGERTKAAFDVLAQYKANREAEARDGSVSIREGVRRYNDNISKYIAGSTPTDQAETIKKHAINYSMTSDTKIEPTKHGQRDDLAVPTVSPVKPANDTTVAQLAKAQEVAAEVKK